MTGWPSSTHVHESSDRLLCEVAVEAHHIQVDLSPLSWRFCLENVDLIEYHTSQGTENESSYNIDYYYEYVYGYSLWLLPWSGRNHDAVPLLTVFSQSVQPILLLSLWFLPRLGHFRIAWYTNSFTVFRSVPVVADQRFTLICSFLINPFNYSSNGRILHQVAMANLIRFTHVMMLSYEGSEMNEISGWENSCLL